MKICPKCQAECSDDVKFCPKCGAELPEAAPKAEERPAFCPQCGKPLEADATFCPGCGAKVGAAPKTPAAVPPIFADSWDAVKTFFTKGPEKAVEKFADNKGLAWIIFSSVAIIFYMFAYAIAGRYRFGLNLLYGFLKGGIFFFGVSALLFAALKVIHKKDVHIFTVFNIAGVASIPIICVSLLNMVITLIPKISFDSMLFVAANVLAILLLYHGIKSIGEYKKSVLLTVAACVAIVAAFIILTFDIVSIIREAVAAARRAVNTIFW
ncbi:MAG: zinc-ribbon domain-containing protein [Clostridia bacterium]|nr:zinc-ribbon domain-containing protein [Clostridia bacterium]